MKEQTDKTKTPTENKDRQGMAKADKAREHSQIDESGAPVDIPDAAKTSKTSDRSNKPDPRKM